MNLNAIALASIFACLAQSLYANNIGERIDYLLKKPVSKVAKLSAASTSFPNVCLAMDFNASRFSEDYSGLFYDHPDKIMRITLVWSEYKQVEGFSQETLNRKRIISLYKLFPNIVMSNKIAWSFISTTGASNDADARKAFHGFILELNQFNEKKIDHRDDKAIFKAITSAFKDSIVEVRKEMKVRCKYKHTGMYLPINKKAKLNGVRHEKSLFGMRKPERFKTCDTVYKPVYEKYKQIDFGHHAMAYRDSAVSTVLNRNTKWTDMLIVCDVTGSMSPFYSDLMLWISMNGLKRSIHGYTFFNDGDNKPDHLKSAGETGGVYHCEKKDFDAVRQSIVNTIVKGNGGDVPENNLEALIKAIEKYKPEGDIVMIADAMAPVSDMKLLSKIKIPVHVVVCGYGRFVHPDYVKIAARTGGSIHSINEEVAFLMEKNEGKRFSFGGIDYIVKNGELKVIKYS